MENKDCTNCRYAIDPDGRDMERCYCTNLEINIFNPKRSIAQTGSLKRSVSIGQVMSGLNE